MLGNQDIIGGAPPEQPAPGDTVLKVGAEAFGC